MVGRTASGCSASMSSIPQETRVLDLARVTETSRPPEGLLEEERTMSHPFPFSLVRDEDGEGSCEEAEQRLVRSGTEHTKGQPKEGHRRIYRAGEDNPRNPMGFGSSVDSTITVLKLEVVELGLWDYESWLQDLQ